MLGLIFLMFIGAGLEVFGIGLILPLVALLKNPAVIESHEIARWFYNASGAASPKEFIVFAVIGLLVFNIVKNIYMFSLFSLQYKFGYGIQIALSKRLFRAYMHAPYTFHLQRNSAQLQSNVIDRVLGVLTGAIFPFLMLMSESLVMGTFLAMLLAMQPATALAVFTVIGLTACAFFYSVRRKLEELGKIQVERNERIIKWVNQGLGGIKDAKVLGREEFFVDALGENMFWFSRAQSRFGIINQSPRFFIETLAIIAMLVIVSAILVQGYEAEFLLSALALFAASAFRLLPSINRIVAALAGLRHCTAAVNAVYQDLVLLEEKRTGPTFAAPIKSAFNRSIELKNISYQYPATAKPAIAGISLTIAKGQSVGFVGPSGAGKTTLIDLFLGLLYPTQGEILADGVTIHSHLAGWQRNVGYIAQTIYLCDDTIRRNIAFGLPDHQIKEDEVRSALEAAQLRDLVDQLPNGLDTVVGERGVRLSGGERQRIGIARALYHNPDILVLDEATSSLDYATEREVTTAIDRLSGYKTLIIIAHRFSTVKGCDEIYSLRAGGLIGKVSYDELTAEVNK